MLSVHVDVRQSKNARRAGGSAPWTEQGAATEENCCHLQSVQSTAADDGSSVRETESDTHIVPWNTIDTLAN